MAPEPVIDVAIIGAGFGGLGAGIALRADGWSVRILERAASVGGVWRDTRYPGAACDIPSLLYCLASRPYPGWSSRFASRGELCAYLEAIGEELRSDLRFGADVASLRWDSGTGVWEIAVGGATQRARAVIVATGPHSRPRQPDWPGLAQFAGGWCHSQDWHLPDDLQDRTVVVVGAGASAVQIIPALAPRVRRLIAVQSSAAWVLPRRDRPRPAWRQRLGRSLPLLDRAERAAIFWGLELLGLGNLGSKPIQAVLKRMALAKLAAEVPDPERRRALTPDYPMGCKRVAVSDDYWPAFMRPNVELAQGRVVAFAGDGPILDNGKHIRADYVVLATGYDVADPAGFLPIAGLPGSTVPELWLRDGAQAYLGTVAAGFPNLAFLLGPNSGPSHSSAIHIIESQIAFVRRWLAALAQEGPIVPRRDVQTRYNVWLAERMRRCVWQSGCTSWYLDRAGRNVALYPGLTSEFRRRLARFELGDFERV